MKSRTFGRFGSGAEQPAVEQGMKASIAHYVVHMR